MRRSQRHPSLASAVKEFDEKVGFNYLRGMHLNDSKFGLASKRDRHENIGEYVERSILEIQFCHID